MDVSKKGEVSDHVKNRNQMRFTNLLEVWEELVHDN